MFTYKTTITTTKTETVTKEIALSDMALSIFSGIFKLLGTSKK